jgi:hypothetical protein
MTSSAGTHLFWYSNIKCWKIVVKYCVGYKDDWQSKKRNQSAATCSGWFPARGFFYPEDGGDTFFQNVG